ncbi:MAG: nucleotidyltransferase family protein [Pseudomonadota bacterium]
MKVHSAMILAAGRGTRMRPLTDTMPKPLLEVAGRPMINRVLDHLCGVGISRAVVNIHHLGDMIRSHLGNLSSPEIHFSDESELLLETGGGIVKALPLLGPDPFVTVNSDAIWKGGNPMADLLSKWDPTAMDALMLLVPRERSIAYSRLGDFYLDKGRPIRRGTAATAPFVYSGAQIIHPVAFDDAPDGPFSTNILWDRLLDRGRLFASVYDGDWVDVGTPDGLMRANLLMSDPL